MILSTDEVCKLYRSGSPHAVRAVDGVSLEVAAGQLTLIRGASGSGKSTLLSLMGGLLRPSSGRVLFDGRDLSLASDAELTRLRRHKLGFVFQNANLIPRLPVWLNVSYPLIPHVGAESERKRRACALLRELQLEDREEHSPEELSGGEQQRVGLARALVNRPELLLADEPTSSLDEDSIVKLLALFEQQRRAGMTQVIVSHDERLVPLADHLFVLSAGRLGPRT